MYMYTYVYVCIYMYLHVCLSIFAGPAGIRFEHSWRFIGSVPSEICWLAEICFYILVEICTYSSRFVGSVPSRMGTYGHFSY